MVEHAPVEIQVLFYMVGCRLLLWVVQWCCFSFFFVGCDASVIA